MTEFSTATTPWCSTCGLQPDTVYEVTEADIERYVHAFKWHKTDKIYKQLFLETGYKPNEVENVYWECGYCATALDRKEANKIFIDLTSLLHHSSFIAQFSTEEKANNYIPTKCNCRDYGFTIEHYQEDHTN